jgi:hypothetical protein
MRSATGNVAQFLFSTRWGAMLSAGFGQLPVTTGGGGLAGIVAITDITAALRGALRMNSPAHEDPSAGR